jgi:hypothetical protein
MNTEYTAKMTVSKQSGHMITVTGSSILERIFDLYRVVYHLNEEQTEYTLSGSLLSLRNVNTEIEQDLRSYRCVFVQGKVEEN